MKAGLLSSGVRVAAAVRGESTGGFTDTKIVNPGEIKRIETLSYIRNARKFSMSKAVALLNTSRFCFLTRQCE